MTEVSAEVVIDDGPHSGPGRLTVLRLVWARHDPFAVHLRLTAHPEHPALPRGEWVVCRDLLQEGLTRPTGDGVVRVRPDDLRDRVWFELERLGRPACVSVPRTVVADFLQRAAKVDPCGQASADQAVDALLLKVLG